LESQERSVLYHRMKSGAFPFRDWRGGLTDFDTRAAVDARVARLRAGNYGDSRPIGGGASESRIHFGPGIRIYYGIDGDNIVLLCGGDKSTQDTDIARAKAFWADYKERTRRLTQ
jgi:putative addiction module killer protein